MKTKVTTEKAAKYIYYSIRERLAAHQIAKYMNLNITHVSPIDGHEKWDVVYEEGIKPQINIAELKVRRKFLEFFDGAGGENGLIFEKLKYDELMEKCNTTRGKLTGIKPKFIVVLFDCVLIFDIINIFPADFKVKDLRASSVNGSDLTKDKMVTYLDPSTAIKIPLEIDYDKLNADAKVIFNYEYPTTLLKINENNQ